MNRILRVALIATLGVMGAPAVADAAGISIFTMGNANVFQNTFNNPCIFDGNGTGDCNPLPPNFPPPVESTQVASPNLTNTIDGNEYDLGWVNAIGGSFILGFDVNNSGGPAQVLTAVTITFQTDAGAQIGAVLSLDGLPLGVPAGSNGQGWADYIFTAGCSVAPGGGAAPNATCPTASLIAFTVPATTGKIIFNLQGTGFNDGPDKLFVIPVVGPQPCIGPLCAPVPEPTSMMLLGTGLVGLAVAVRRRRRTI